MRGLLSSCSAERASSVVVVCMLSSCGWLAPECVGGLLSSRGTWAPEHVGSVVAAPGLSCPVACGNLVPQPGIEPVSPALEGGFLTTGPPGKSRS